MQAPSGLEPGSLNFKVLFISKYDVLTQILEIQVRYLKNPNWYEEKIHVWKTCTISIFGK